MVKPKWVANFAATPLGDGIVFVPENASDSGRDREKLPKVFFLFDSSARFERLYLTACHRSGRRRVSEVLPLGIAALTRRPGRVRVIR